MTEQELDFQIEKVIEELEAIGKVIAALRQERQMYDKMLKEQDVLIKRLSELTKKMSEEI